MHSFTVVVRVPFWAMEGGTEVPSVTLGTSLQDDGLQEEGHQGPRWR